MNEQAANRERHKLALRANRRSEPLQCRKQILIPYWIVVEIFLIFVVITNSKFQSHE